MSIFFYLFGEQHRSLLCFCNCFQIKIISATVLESRNVLAEGFYVLLFNMDLPIAKSHEEK